jgi:hypothetical protein
MSDTVALTDAAGEAGPARSRLHEREPRAELALAGNLEDVGDVPDVLRLRLQRGDEGAGAWHRMLTAILPMNFNTPAKFLHSPFARIP